VDAQTRRVSFCTQLESVPEKMGTQVAGIAKPNREWSIKRNEDREGFPNLLAFKRPAPAVWGNGLWGSVGGAGRSYD